MSLLRDRRTLIAGLALVYTALFMPAVVMVQPQATSTVDLAVMLLGAFVYSWAFFFTIRAIRPLFLIVTPLIFFASAVASYYMYHFHFEVTHHHLALIFEEQTQTAAAFISWQLILWSGISTWAGYWLARRCIQLEIPDPRNARLLFITCILMVSIFVQEAGGITQRYFPYNILFAAKGVVGEKIALTRGDKTSAVAIDRPNQPPVTVILIVGESARAHNWGLNGYTRQTTPLLSKRAGVINFSDVTSCFPLTRIAVPCILTDVSHTSTAVGEHSLIQLFKQLGFFTASIDMQGMGDSALGGPVGTLLQQSHRLDTFNGGFISDPVMDEAGIQSLTDILTRNSKNLFVVFHTFGSHWPFDTRYPESFRTFKPVCSPTNPKLLELAQDMAECDPEALMNAYDNSILYSDHITNDVMKSVKGRAALVLFTSDHGQSLGEDGLFLHGHPNAKMERHVPMVVWATPEFEKAYPNAMNQMRTTRDKPITHDVIFHSLLDCVGAKSPVIDPKQSLCSATFDPAPSLLPKP